MAKQIWYSEELDKSFETEEACLEAEKEYEKKVALEKAKKEERKERAEEVEKAFKDANDAYNNAKELLNKFCEDYGSFHKTVTSVNSPTTKSLFDLFFNDKFFSLF